MEFKVSLTKQHSAIPGKTLAIYFKSSSKYPAESRGRRFIKTISFKTNVSIDNLKGEYRLYQSEGVSERMA